MTLEVEQAPNRRLARFGAKIVGGVTLIALGVGIVSESGFDSIISDEGSNSPLARLAVGALISVAGIGLVINSRQNQEQ